MATPFRPVRRVQSGIEAIRSAHEIQRQNKRLEQWPYEWLFPPPDSERVHVEGSLDVQTIAGGPAVEVLEYQVQNNYKFRLTGIVQIYVGQNAVVPGDGNVLWGLDINIPLGQDAPQGYPVQGFDQSGISKGGFISGVIMPYPLSKAEELKPLDTLRSKVTVSSQITAGRVITIFDGWILPV